MVKKILSLFIFAACFFVAFSVSAQDLGGIQQLVYLNSGNVQINNPESLQTFYDELKGKPRDYLIDSDKNFELYLNIMVPEVANMNGKYSATVSSVADTGAQQITELDGGSYSWQDFYSSFDRDWFQKGPELDQQLPPGKYKIEIYSKDNQGKYVLVAGKKTSSDILSVLNIYWQLPMLKASFLKTSVLQFFLTPFGIAGIGILGAVLIFIALINYLIGLFFEIIKHNQAKTLLLTSGGMPEMKDEIIKLLQKPAYDITVAFITTAAKPQDNLEYVKRDWDIMKTELGFNIEEFDIEGKTQMEVYNFLELKDIVFVEGGNTFYLLNAMRKCNFEKVIRKLLKSGKVYIGVSAGSIVAGRTIQTANKLGTGKNENIVNLKDFKGLNLVPFDIFVHYKPEDAEIIKQKIKNPKKRQKKLKILTDQQALLVQGKEVDLIGDGDAIIV